jgi:hypothetical protein
MAPPIWEGQLPSHAVHVAVKSRINDTSVIQKPVIHKLAVPRIKGKVMAADNIADPRSGRPNGLYHAR